MSRFWSSAVHALEPYVAGEQPKIPGLVKLITFYDPDGNAFMVSRSEAAA